MEVEQRDHTREQLEAIARLTYHQWFQGRAAHAQENRVEAADFAEQAMRADYIADKAWWYRTYQPERFPTFASAVAEASTELPAPAGGSRSTRRGWVERIDLAVMASAREVPSHQWTTTLLPTEAIDPLGREGP